jgi:hypothetical protein
MERNVLENRAESQYLVKRPQSGLNTKAYWLTDWLTDRQP